MTPVCVPCTSEMECTKTGVLLHYGHGHVYAGDRFSCRHCDADVVKPSALSHHMSPEQLEQQGDNVIEMPRA